MGHILESSFEILNLEGAFYPFGYAEGGDSVQSLSLLLEVCCISAGLLIENGSETYRAEDTVRYLCKKCNVQAGVAVLSTTLFIQMQKDGQARQAVRRLNQRTIHLDCIAQVNAIVRAFCDDTITLEQAYAQLTKLRRKELYSWQLRLLCYSVTAVLALFLFGGSRYDVLPALMCGLVYPCMPMRWKDRASFQMILFFVFGVVVAVIAVLSAWLCEMVRPVAVITASALSLYPGAALVNAIRDTMYGDLVSGVARFAEAFFKFGMLAAGTAAVLGFFGDGVQLPAVGGSQPWYYLAQLIIAFFVVLCLSVEQSAPSRTLLASSLIGAVSYFVCRLLAAAVPFMPAAYFLAALLMALCSEGLARFMKLPATVFLISSIMVLVPGKGLFDSMLYMASGMYSQFLQAGVDTMVQMIAISLAIAIGTFVFRSLFSVRRPVEGIASGQTEYDK